MRLYSNTGRIQGYIYSGGGWRGCTTATAAPLNQWSYVVQTFDGNIGRVYINGVQGCTYSYAGEINSGINSLKIGTYYTSVTTNERFKGAIDEVRIYGRALDVSEIAQHFNNSYTNEADLRGIWHFDEGSGQTLSDSSALGNNGTLGPTVASETTDPSWQPDGPSWQPNPPTDRRANKVSPLEGSKNYKYKVKAFGADTESTPSNEVPVDTPSCLPAKPDLVATPKCDINNNSYIQLSWSSDPNTVSWRIEKDGTTIIPATTQTSYPDTDITPGDHHTYEVFAAGVGVPSTPSDLISVTASLCTKDPSKPSVTAQAACYGYSSRARLNWQEDPSGYTLSFNVWRKNITLGEADFTKIQPNLPSTQTQYVDNLVPILNDLRYKLEAVGEATNIFSDESNQITTLDCNNLPPNPPVLSNDPPISTGDYIGVVLHWKDSGNEEEYRLFRKEIDGVWNEIIQLPANDDPATLIYYADSAISGLEDNKTYEYVAVAYNKNKPYDEANPIYSGSFSNFWQVYIPIAKPGNFTLSGTWQINKINLTWTAAATTDAGGTVTYKVVKGNSDFTETYDIDSCQDISTLNCTDNNPSFSQTFYKVIAKNNGGTNEKIINMALPALNWKELIPWF